MDARIDDYELLGELGRGGAGVVFRGRARDGAAVAIKVLGEGAPDSHVARRFRREVDALRRLDHPHVLRVLDAGHWRGRPYLVLPLLEGGSLQARLDRAGALAPRAAAELLVPLTEAVAAAHRAGLLHRDLKPDNVLFSAGQPVLTDFGLVSDLEQRYSRMTQSGMFLGTPGYWAPEQARGEVSRLDPRTDVYGLGGVLYAALTSHPPFRAGSLQEALDQVEHQRPAPPRALNPAIDAELEAICLRCLEKDPSARYLEAEALREALVDYLAGRRVGAATTPARRRAGIVALAAFAASALCAGLGITAWRARAPMPERVARTWRPPRTTEPASPARTPAPATGRPRPEPGVDPTWPGRAPEGSLAALEAARKAPPRELLRPPALLELLTDASPEEVDRALAAWWAPRPDAGIVRAPRPAGEAPRTPLAWIDALPAGDAADVHAIRAFARERRGDLQGALADLDRAIELEPRAGHLVARANLHVERGDHVFALTDLSKAIEQEPRHGRYYDRGNSYAALGRLEEALADYSQALRLQPDFQSALMNRGATHARLKDYEAAARDFDRVIELAPNDAHAYASRSLLRAQRGDLEGARADIDRSLELEPLDLARRLQRANLRERQRDLQGALEDYDEVLRRTPRDARTRVNRGVVQAQLGNYAAAEGDLLRARQDLAPDDPARATLERMLEQVRARARR